MSERRPPSAARDSSRERKTLRIEVGPGYEKSQSGRTESALPNSSPITGYSSMASTEQQRPGTKTDRPQSSSSRQTGVSSERDSQTRHNPDSEQLKITKTTATERSSQGSRRDHYGKELRVRRESLSVIADPSPASPKVAPLIANHSGLDTDSAAAAAARRHTPGRSQESSLALESASSVVASDHRRHRSARKHDIIKVEDPCARDPRGSSDTEPRFEQRRKSKSERSQASQDHVLPVATPYTRDLPMPDSLDAGTSGPQRRKLDVHSKAGLQRDSVTSTNMVDISYKGTVDQDTDADARPHRRVDARFSSSNQEKDRVSYQKDHKAKSRTLSSDLPGALTGGGQGRGGEESGGLPSASAKVSHKVDIMTKEDRGSIWELQKVPQAEHQELSKDEVAEVISEAADLYDDEQFEDYDDDFESDKESPPLNQGQVQKLVLAVQSENSKPFLRHTSQPISSRKEISNEPILASPAQSDATPGTPRIDFVSSSKLRISDQNSSLLLNRAKTLLKLIQLDAVHVDIFNMQPLSSYELFSRKYGKSNISQASTQTGWDCPSTETQTQAVLSRSVLVQHSPAGMSCEEDKENAPVFALPKPVLDLDGLRHFLGRTIKVLETVLRNNSAASSFRAETKPLPGTVFSGMITSSLPCKCTAGRKVRSVSIPSALGSLFLACAGPSEEKGPPGIVFLWNPGCPEISCRYLLCASEPVSCCFISGGSICAGMVDGSLVLWDLNQSLSSCVAAVLCAHEVEMIKPAYTTAGLSSAHSAPIVAITELGNTRGLSGIDNCRDQGMYVCSVDESWTAILWTVIVAKERLMESSSSDLHLSIGARLKLQLSSTVQFGQIASPSLRRIKSLGDPVLLSKHTSDPAGVIVGTNWGFLTPISFSGSQTSPKMFGVHSGPSVPVTCMDIYPWGEPFILAGYHDGSLALFVLSLSGPVWTFSPQTGGQDPVIAALWSKSRPSVFFTLSTSARLDYWNLCDSPAVPSGFTHLPELMRPISLSFLTADAAKSTFSETTEALMVVDEDGRSVTLMLSESVTKALPDELDQMTSFNRSFCS